MSATVNKNKTVLVVVALIGASLAQYFPTAPARPATRPPLPPITLPPRTPIQPPPPQPPMTYVLPASAELVVGPIYSTFSCNNRIYGYYADIDNNCQIFHVCVPFVDEHDNQFPIIYSFFCGNQTVFDQANLVCAYTSDATPCSEAPLFYNVNENFGKTDQPIISP